MITALAEAAPVFHEPQWLEAAEQAFAFVRDNMQEDGRLKHAWRHGSLRHPATLDDYACNERGRHRPLRGHRAG